MAAKVRRPPAPRLDEGAKSYYKRVEDALEGGGDGEETLFLRNVVDQVISDGMRLVSCDKDGSRALERLIQHFSMNTDSITKLMKAAEPNFFKLCVNRCGSHVIQTLLKAASHALQGSSHAHSGEAEHTEELLELFLSFVSTVEEKLSDCVRHPYACHVLSGLLQELGGVHVSDATRSRYSREFRKAKMVGVGDKKGASVIVVPDSFKQRLDDIARMVCKMKDLKELLTHQNASPVLQCLLRVVSQSLPKRSEKLIKKVIKLTQVLGGVEGCGLPDIFTDMVGSHVTEAMIDVAPSHLRQLLFSSCFKGRVMTAALHPVANFPLQHLIAVAGSSLLAEISAELRPLEDVLYAGHTGVVVKLAEAAVACPEVQPALLQDVMEAFHTTSHPEAVAPVVLALLTYEIFTAEGKEGEGVASQQEPHPNEEGVASQKEPHPNEEGVASQKEPHPSALHGSLLLQALLKFKEVKVVVRSVLKLKKKELARLSCDANGSHVLTTFLTSASVPSGKKEKLGGKLEDNLVMLCKDKHGSRVVDTVWRHSQLDRKEEIAKLLLAHEDELSADFHGSIVLRNCNIAHFRKKQEGWAEQQRAASRKRELFQDLLEEGGQSSATGQSSPDRKKKRLQSSDERATKRRKR